ncbi:TPA: hypothetical protein ACGAD2_005512 [Salmonella enterica subsp. enterica serovar Newport]|nr:hypothetical protein [Salmonella enterica subsp. enterica serovar Newport]ECV9048858.1 hypothetical protein [Salmonella enterica subsp. enterica serovar Newport]
MLMMLLSDNRVKPKDRINVRAVSGYTLASNGQSVPVKALSGNIASGGNTLSIPVKAVCGTTMDSGADLQKPVKSVYGYLLVTEV